MQQGSAGLYEEVRFGATAWKVEYQGNKVSVHYTTDASLGTLHIANSLAQRNVIRGDVTIITLPLNIIRQLTFQPPLNSSISGSIADVYYCPSTKIMLQCREILAEGSSPNHWGLLFHRSTDQPAPLPHQLQIARRPRHRSWYPNGVHLEAGSITIRCSIEAKCYPGRDRSNPKDPPGDSGAFRSWWRTVMVR